VANYVTLSWSLPDNNGDEITEYQIFVQEKVSGTFTQESTDCVSSSESVVAARECTIQLDTLKADPYNLVFGDSVNVKVSAINAYGTSALSPIGNGALI